MNRPNQSDPMFIARIFFITIGVLTVTGLIVYFAIQAASFVVTLLALWGTEIDSEVMAALISVALTFSFTYWSTLRLIRSRSTEQINLQKIETYQELVYLLAKTIQTVELQNTENNTDSVNRLAAQLIVCGSSDVIKLFRQWRMMKEEGNLPQLLMRTRPLLLEIRNDLKMNNKDIGEGDLLSCITNEEKITSKLSHDFAQQQTRHNPFTRWNT